MVNKTILVTTVQDASGNESNIFGRYDPVALIRRGYTIKSSCMVKCGMNEETFYNNATTKENLT